MARSLSAARAATPEGERVHVSGKQVPPSQEMYRTAQLGGLGSS